MLKKFLVLLGCAVVSAAHAATFTVNVKMPVLVGLSGFLAFDLVGGAPLQDNRLVINSFLSDAVLGVGTGAGDFSGALAPATLSLSTGSSFFNEWSNPIVFGSSINFSFTTTNNYGAGTPDNFSFYVLNFAGLPYGTSDPSGAGAAVSVDIYTDNVPVAYSSPYFLTTVSAAPIAAVPEPSVWFLLCLGLAGIVTVPKLRGLL